MSDRTYAPDAESTAGFPRAALPDDPNEEMRPAEWSNARATRGKSGRVDSADVKSSNVSPPPAPIRQKNS